MWLFKSAHKHINQDTLSEYLDGRLQGTGLERVEQRLGECDACRQELEELQATVAMMRQLPMETPRRSFVMSAPPPEPVRSQPFLVLRAPNWVYAGAASVAALALAVTVSMDATGGLSSDPLRRDFAVTAMSPAPESDQTITTIGTSGGAAEATSGLGDTEMAPTSMTAEAPAAATADSAVPDEQAGGITVLQGEGFAAPTSAPAVSSTDSESQNSATAPIESARAEPGLTSNTPEDGQSQEPQSTTSAPEPYRESPPVFIPQDETAKSLPTDAAAESPVPEFFDQNANGPTSIWWRVLEAGAGALTVAFAVGLALHWRTNRRDSA
ncbi:MAG: hypothetical protein HQ475_12055 [SAR202 cluster bacterium]|nr:hypothetical protein [SAR202 cluster bacterium]